MTSSLCASVTDDIPVEAIEPQRRQTIRGSVLLIDPVRKLICFADNISAGKPFCAAYLSPSPRMVDSSKTVGKRCAAKFWAHVTGKVP